MESSFSRAHPSLGLTPKGASARWLMVSVATLLWLFVGTTNTARAGVLCVDPTGAHRCHRRIADAIAAAWSGETIVVYPGYYNEHSLSIAKDLTLIAEPGRVTVDGGGHQIFWAIWGYTSTLRGFTLVNGHARSGGALFNKGILTLESLEIRDSRADYDGGAIYNEGVMTITGIRLQGNTARRRGGAIANGRTLVLVGGDFRDNRALGEGGGFYNESLGWATFRAVRMKSNQASSGSAVWNDGALGFERAWFGGNVASDGATIHNQGALSLVNATLAQNRGTGGVLRNSATFSLRNVTLARNSSGPAIVHLAGSASLRSALIADNAAAACMDTPEGWWDNAWSMADDDTCGPGVAVKSRQQLALGVPGAHGSALQTIPLLPGSAAIDSGFDTVCPHTDQRGMTRPRSGHCDIGAYEYQGAADDVVSPVLALSATLDTTTLLLTSSFTVTNYGPLDATHVVVSIVLPDQAGLLDADAAQGLAQADDAMLWLIDALPAGQHRSLTLQARIAERLRGQIVSVSASVAAAEPVRDASTSQVQIDLRAPWAFEAHAHLPLMMR